MFKDEESQSYAEYVNRMKRNGTWGGNLELQGENVSMK